MEGQTDNQEGRSGSGGSGACTDAPADFLGDKFLIKEKLASGGMGVLYRARQLDVDREVAVKVLPNHLLASSGGLERFRRESVVCARLDHPSIVKVYASGISPGGQPYLVMDFLEGKSLEQVLSECPRLPLPRFFRLFVQIIEAVAYAHGCGVLHRDLKPSNVILVGEGELEKAKLIDFGIARLLDESLDQKLTATGAVIGTSAYMSPEQCRGESLDERTDIYSLGCLMYHCLIGEAPFAGDSDLCIMYKHLHERESRLRGLGSLPEPLAELLVRCLRKARQDRFASVRELADAFAGSEVAAKSQRGRLGAAVWLGCFFCILSLLFGQPWRKPNSTDVLEEMSAPQPGGMPQRGATASSDIKRDLARCIGDGDDVTMIARCKRWLEANGGGRDDDDTALVTAYLAESARKTNDLALADVAVENALGRVRNEPRRAGLLLQRARNRTAQKRLDEAEKIVRELLGSSQRNEEITAVPGWRETALLLLVDLLLNDDRYEEARQCLLECRELMKARREWNSVQAMPCLRKLAVVASQTDQPQAVASYLEQMSKLADSAKPAEKAWSKCLLADAYVAVGKPALAVRLFQDAGTLHAESNRPAEAAAAIARAAEAAERSADREQAQKIWLDYRRWLKERDRRKDMLVANQSHLHYLRDREMAPESARLCAEMLENPDLVGSSEFELWYLLESIDWSLTAQNRVRDAEKVLLKAVDISANRPDRAVVAKLVLANYYLRRRQWAEAEKILTRAGSELTSRQRGQWPEAIILRERAKAAFGRKSFAEASALLERSLASFGKQRFWLLPEQEARRLLVQAYSGQGRNYEAARSVREQLELARDQGLTEYVNALLFTADWHLAAGHPAEAEQFLLQADSIAGRLASSDRARVQRNYLKLYTAQGQWKQAEKIVADWRAYWHHQERIQPVDAVAFLSLAAELKVRLKKWQEARKLYRDAITICNTTFGLQQITDFQLGLAKVYLLEGNFVRSEALYEKILSECSKTGSRQDALSHAVAARGLAELYAHNKLYAKAMPHLETSIEELRELKDCGLEELAYTYMERARCQKGMKLDEAAADSLLDAANYWRRLGPGKAHLEKQALEEALALVPESREQRTSLIKSRLSALVSRRGD